MADSRVDELRRRLERDPRSRLFAQLAEELRKSGEVEEAITVARAGLERHPSYSSARLTLGRALLDSGDPGAARAELESAVREAPDNILASRLLGEALETLGDLGEALVRYRTTLEMAPGDGHVESRVRAIQERLRGGGPAPPPAPAQEITKPMAAVQPGVVDGSAPRGARKVPPPLPPTVRLPAGPKPDSPPRAPLPPTEATGPEPWPSTSARGGLQLDQPLPPTVPLGVRGSAEGGIPSGGAPSAGAETAGAGDAAQPPLSSATLAELYFQQGLVERAVEVYRQVLDEEPDNGAVRTRLEELQSGARASAGGRPGPALNGDEKAARRQALEAAIRRLEALLLVVRRR